MSLQDPIQGRFVFNSRHFSASENLPENLVYQGFCCCSDSFFSKMRGVVKVSWAGGALQGPAFWRRRLTKANRQQYGNKNECNTQLLKLFPWARMPNPG